MYFYAGVTDPRSCSKRMQSDGDKDTVICKRKKKEILHGGRAVSSCLFMVGQSTSHIASASSRDNFIEISYLVPYR